MYRYCRVNSTHFDGSLKSKYFFNQSKKNQELWVKRTESNKGLAVYSQFFLITCRFSNGKEKRIKEEDRTKGWRVNISLTGETSTSSTSRYEYDMSQRARWKLSPRDAAETGINLLK